MVCVGTSNCDLEKDDQNRFMVLGESFFYFFLQKQNMSKEFAILCFFFFLQLFDAISQTKKKSYNEKHQ